MEYTIEQQYKKLLQAAIEHWGEKRDETFKDIEKDPVVKLLLSALAYQASNIQQNIDSLQNKMVTEFRNKLIPYHLIKPTPAFSLLQTKIKTGVRDGNNILPYYIVNETNIFKFGRNKINFVPLLETKIINAEISDKQINETYNTINLEISSDIVIENFSKMSFYFDCKDDVDIDIFLNGQPLPIIKPDNYDDFAYTMWFKQNFLLSEHNQLLFGHHHYWQELFVLNHIQLFYIDDYDANIISSQNLSNTFTIQFRHKPQSINLNRLAIKINCIPIVNVEKQNITLSHSEPIKNISPENKLFLNLLFNENLNTNDFLIRHFGVERYNPQELLFHLNMLCNRFITDFYAFKGIDELKKGDKLENLYNIFQDIFPIVKKNSNDYLKGIYAILKLDEKSLAYKNKVLEIDYLCTNGAQANGIKAGEKATFLSEYFDKEKTSLIMESTGGENEELTEENLNHIARYYLLTKNKLITHSDIKAFCYKELKTKIKNIQIINENGMIHINILSESELDQKEKEYWEYRIKRKIELYSTIIFPIKLSINVLKK